jgi:pimeloyl-ACP methyl ester carboxylesterase
MGAMKDAYEKETYDQFLSIKPETFNFPQVKDPYVKVAPDPGKWPGLVQRIMELGRTFKGFTPAQVKGIKAPVLVMMGDREGIRLEHAVEMRRTIPNAQLAIFPNADHFLIFMSPDKVMATLLPFLEAPAT